MTHIRVSSPPISYSRIEFMTAFQEISGPGITIGTVGRVFLAAKQIEVTKTLDRIIIWIMGTSAGNCRVAIYRDMGDTPVGGALVVESTSQALPGAWDCFEVVITATRLAPGLYWLAIMFDDATAVVYSHVPIFVTSGGSTLIAKRLLVDPGYGAFPDPCPAIQEWVAPPLMGVRVASTP